MKRIATYVLIVFVTAILAASVAAAPAGGDHGAGATPSWWSSAAAWTEDLVDILLAGAGRHPSRTRAAEEDRGPEIDPIGNSITVPINVSEQDSGDRGPEIDPIG
jgi:hypothetical protein